MTCLGSRCRLKTSYVDILLGQILADGMEKISSYTRHLSQGMRQSPPPLLPLPSQLELGRYNSQPPLCRVPSVFSIPRLVLSKISGQEVIGGFQR